MRTIAELVRWRARIHPDRAALVFEGRSTSYAELDHGSSRVANALIASGVTPGERVCVLDQNHDLMFETIFGLAKAGAVFTPVNWRLAPAEIAYVVQDAGASVLIVGPTFRPAAKKVRESVDGLKTVVCYGAADESDCRGYQGWRDGASDEDPRRESGEDEAVWQLYTSGTTGQPKGAVLSNGNLFTALANGMLLGPRIRPADRALVCVPLYHIGGSGYALVVLYAGMTAVVASVFDPGAILSAIEEHRVTQAFLVPTMMNFLLQHPACAETDFSSLEAIVYGASPIPAELLVQLLERFGCEFYQTYGLTETTGVVSVLSAEEHRAGSELLRSCGRPLLGLDLCIVDSDGRNLGCGEVGEIVIRGGTVMQGYWNRPQDSEAAIRRGWFHTGDAGYVDERGYLYIHDRVKDMIVTGAENVYPAEVENALFEHPEVADVAVIGVPDKRWGEAVKAVVQRSAGATVSEETLIIFCRQRIAGFKCPKSVDFVDGLPRNPTGKLLKRELRERYWGKGSRRVN